MQIWSNFLTTDLYGSGFTFFKSSFNLKQIPIPYKKNLLLHIFSSISLFCHYALFAEYIFSSAGSWTFPWLN